MGSLRPLLLALLPLAIPAAAGRADTLWLGGNGGNAIEAGGVQIQDVREGKLLFRAPGGRDSVRDVGQVVRVAADNEPALNVAEEALAKGQLELATENFRKALASSAREWVKVWSAQRLATVAPRANRFDAAASGYLALLARDPARAAEYKPPLPPARSTFIDNAINEANNVLAAPNVSAEAKQAIQAFVAELQQAKGGGAVGAVPPAQAGSPASPQAGDVAAAASAAAASAADQQVARQALAAASAALERKDFAGAINQIRANAKILTDARDQAQALYFLAEAQTGLAGAKNDVPSWQDAALAYMRVVAHFQDVAPTAPAVTPFVARAMLKAAQIHETLRDPAAARTLYEQLVAAFPADPAANDAKAALARLKP